MNIREIVETKLAAVVAAHSPVAFPDTIDDDDLLDAFGLDSVAFVALLAEIEEAAGRIPPAILEGDFYPETFGELVSAYEQ